MLKFLKKLVIFPKKVQIYSVFFAASTKKPQENPIFSTIKPPTSSNYTAKKPFTIDQKTKSDFLYKLSKSSKNDYSSIFSEFSPRIQKMTEIHAIKGLFLQTIKLKIKEESFLIEMLKLVNSNFETIIKRPINEKILFIYFLSKTAPLENSTFFLESKGIIERILNNIMENLSETELFLIPIMNISHILFACQKFQIINREFLSSNSLFFRKKIAEYSDIDLISSLYNIVKIFAFIEKNSFIHGQDYSQLIFEIKGLIYETPEIRGKVKQAILNNQLSLWNLTNLAWAFSRIGYENPEVWQLILDYLALNYKTMEDSNFKIILASITALNKVNNVFLLTEFKSHFDSRIHENLEKINTEYFSRCFRAFLPSTSAIITNEDFSLPLYEKYINFHIDEFKLEHNISLMYSLAQMNYKNKELIDKILEKSFLQMNDSTLKKQENVSLFFWSGAILLTSNGKFWDFYQKYLSFIDFEYMNKRNLVNNLLSLYILKNYKSSQILDQNLINSQFKSLSQKTFAQVFSKNTTDNKLKAFPSFDIFTICHAIGLKIHTELVVEIYPVDYYLENFLEIDYDEKIQNIKEIVENYNRIFPGEGKEILEKIQGFQSLEDSENFIKGNKEKSLIIEVHGLTHFILEERFQKGSTILKKKILDDKGFNVLVLNFSKCQEIGNVPNVEERIMKILEIFKEKKEVIGKKQE